MFDPRSASPIRRYSPGMNREALSEALKDHVVNDERVLVAWFGGSDATGRTDELSDLDPVLVAAEQDIEGVATTTFHNQETALISDNKPVKL